MQAAPQPPIGAPPGDGGKEQGGFGRDRFASSEIGPDAAAEMQDLNSLIEELGGTWNFIGKHINGSIIPQQALTY